MKKLTIWLILVLFSISLVSAFNYTQPQENYFTVNQTSGEVKYQPINQTWLDFNGSASFNISNVVNLSNATGLTISFWYKPNTNSTWQSTFNLPNIMDLQTDSATPTKFRWTLKNQIAVLLIIFITILIGMSTKGLGI